MLFLDLFAGIGGFRLGMQQAGHEPVGWCEIDKYAQVSYRAIHKPQGEWFHDDITTAEPLSMPDFECLTAGFPCQAFSVAGKRGGFKDTRGTLFFEICRIARIKKPKYLFLENVKGLLSHDGGKTFGTILTALDELGYDCEWQVLNSKDFGVPQNRERVFIIGHFRGKRTRKVFPIEGSNGKALKQLIGGQQGMRVYDPHGVSATLSSEGGGWGAKTGLYFIDLSTQEAKVTCNARALQARYNKGYSHRKGENSGVLEIRPCLTPDRAEKRQNGNGIAFCEQRTDEGLRFFKDGTCGAIRAMSVSNYRIRKLTPLECWRLQGFPDWTFKKAKAAGVSDSQLYRQAGNSVTVPVIYEIARRLKP